MPPSKRAAEREQRQQQGKQAEPDGQSQPGAHPNFLRGAKYMDAGATQRPARRDQEQQGECAHLWGITNHARAGRASRCRRPRAREVMDESSRDRTLAHLLEKARKKESADELLEKARDP